jgi:hypothetical protein
MHERAIKRAASPNVGGRPPAKKFKSTTRGPTRKLIYIYVEATFSGNYDTAINLINRRLMAGRRRVRIVHAVEDGDAIVLHTDEVPNQEDVEIVREGIRVEWFYSRHDVRAELAASRSFIKIPNVPYLNEDSGTPITRGAVEAILLQHPVLKNFTMHGKPRISRNKGSADMCTVWFEVWDSKRGSNLDQIENKPIRLGGKLCRFKAAPVHAGTPQCQRCWYWEHAEARCTLNRNICAHCGGSHELKHHRTLATCCKAQPKASPPIAATPADEPCPHAPKCVNCGKDHCANDESCTFFRHRFKSEWIQRRYERGEVSLSQQRASNTPTDVLSRPKNQKRTKRAPPPSN